MNESGRNVGSSLGIGLHFFSGEAFGFCKVNRLCLSVLFNDRQPFFHILLHYDGRDPSLLELLASFGIGFRYDGLILSDWVLSFH